MNIKPDQKDALVAKFASRLESPCVICGSKNFNINKQPLALLTVPTSVVTPRPQTSYFPVFPVTCEGCGNVRFFSAVHVLGELT